MWVVSIRCGKVFMTKDTETSVKAVGMLFDVYVCSIFFLLYPYYSYACHYHSNILSSCSSNVHCQASWWYVRISMNVYFLTRYIRKIFVLHLRSTLWSKIFQKGQWLGYCFQAHWVMHLLISWVWTVEWYSGHPYHKKNVFRPDLRL